MVGRVFFKDDSGRECVLTLDPDGTVRCDCPDPVPGELFRQKLIQHCDDYGPSKGVWGHGPLHWFAHKYRGTLEIEKIPPAGGRIF